MCREYILCTKEKKMLFSIKDDKRMKFGSLFECENAQTAIREVVTVFMQCQNAFFTKFPSHFSLYKIGEMNYSTGSIISQTPELVVNLLKCKEMAMDEVKKNMVRGENAYEPKEFTPSPSGDEEV